MVDGAVNGLAKLGNILGQELRLIQTGRVQNYMLILSLSLLMLAGLFIILTQKKGGRGHELI